MTPADSPTGPSLADCLDANRLGVWTYEFNAQTHTRTFTADGLCVLRSGKEVQWRKSFDVISESEVWVKGGLRHVIGKDGTMKIEGRYTARKQ